MRNAIRYGPFLFCVLWSASARADPFVVSTTTIATSGWFDCRSTIACSGEGTNSVTFDSGGATGTVTFTGVSSTFDVTNGLTPVTLGSFNVTSTPGFTFPTHPANPGAQPILRFLLSMEQSAPVPSDTVRMLQFGPGGGTSVPATGTSYLSLPLGSNPFDYTSIVYTLRPFPFSLPVNGTTALTAEVGVVPEPASMVLLGTGLLGAVAARRRRKAAGGAGVQTT